MTLKDIRRELARIKSSMDDNEVAHMIEDALYRDVLQAIADGADNPAALAAAALKAEKLDYARWYA